MKKRFLVASLVVILAASMAVMVGCANENAYTHIKSVTVSPPSGSGSFNLSVTYTYRDGTGDAPENVDCRFVTPDSATFFIGSIRPRATGTGGLKTETATLPFTVTPKTNGVTPPGTYTAECYTPSDPEGVATTFILSGEAETTTTTTAETTTTSEAQASTTTTQAATSTTTTTAQPGGQLPPEGVTLEGKVIDGPLITGFPSSQRDYYDFRVTENSFRLQIVPKGDGTGSFAGTGIVSIWAETVSTYKGQRYDWVETGERDFTFEGTWDGADTGRISAQVTMEFPEDKRTLVNKEGKTESPPQATIHGTFEGTFSIATGQLTGHINAEQFQDTLQAKVVAAQAGA
jgi:hypothetical protein